MNDPLKTKSFKIGATVAPYRIVKFDSDDDTIIQAAAAGDFSIGVANNLGALSTEDRCDVHTHGIAEVEYGGNVTRGDELTADGDGKAVAAAPGGGSNVRLIGMAMKSGVSGDIGSVLIAQSVMQG